ncbi:MAG: RidA family protein [Brevinematales bacterium]|nr:RidA family protein [Brevinematales bacterium]
MKFFEEVGGLKPLGHYSTAVILENGMLFLSGQIDIQENTVSGQTRNILKNINTILSELGYSKKNIFKVVVYITDISKFSDFNDAYREFFEDHKPVRTTIGVKELPKGALVEIEVYAFKP